MKLLVATKETQGQRKSDFCHAEEGEPVVYVLVECDNERVDGPCGCRRSMVGVRTGKGTTTVKIADMNEDSYAACLAHYYRYRWSIQAADADDLAAAMVQDVNRVAERGEVGDVLERRGRRWGFRVRNCTVHPEPARTEMTREQFERTFGPIR